MHCPSENIQPLLITVDARSDGPSTVVEQRVPGETMRFLLVEVEIRTAGSITRSLSDNVSPHIDLAEASDEGLDKDAECCLPSHFAIVDSRLLKMSGLGSAR